MATCSPKACALAVTALALVAAGSFAAQSRPYLPKVGPTSLRFQPVPGSKSLNLPPLAKQDPSVSTVTNMPGFMETSYVVLRASSPDPVAQSYFFSVPWLYPMLGMDVRGNDAAMPRPEGVNSATNAVPSPQAASDMLIVTPQMLVDYFKPSPTNAANALAPAAVGFTPAAPPSRALSSP